MIAFDVPATELQNMPFEYRFAFLIAATSPDNPIVISSSLFLFLTFCWFDFYYISASRVWCRNDTHITKWVESVSEDRGEGVILRLHCSLYIHGKTQSLIKIKVHSYRISPHQIIFLLRIDHLLQSFAGDKEGIVVACSEDKSVKLKLYVFFRFCQHLSLPNLCLYLISFLLLFIFRLDGQTLVVKAQDVLIRTPSIGDVVTFSYESHSRRDEPVNPKIFRVRADVSWEELMESNAREGKRSTGRYQGESEDRTLQSILYLTINYKLIYC